jgi:hypothetical protein
LAATYATVVPVTVLTTLTVPATPNRVILPVKQRRTYNYRLNDVEIVATIAGWLTIVASRD